MKTPKFSVLMPVYNAELYLRQAIESVLQQTFTDFELIIINDGSKDSSKAIILSYKDDRIQYIENENNIGLIATLNKGIALCSGTYILRMDADDVCYPNRFEKQADFLKNHPKAGVCGSWVKLIDKDGNITGDIINQTKSELIKIHLLFSVPLIHPSTCIETSLLKKNLYENILAAEDYDLWCRLASQTEFANIPDFLLQYRWHDTNVSKEKAVIQQESKNSVIRRQLEKLGLRPTDEQLRIHKLSFSLYSFEGKTNQKVSTQDLKASGDWFKKLIAANKKIGLYKRSDFKAFLWGRWMVLSLNSGKKIRACFPPFFSFSSKVLLLAAKQLVLLSKKISGNK